MASQIACLALIDAYLELNTYVQFQTLLCVTKFRNFHVFIFHDDIFLLIFSTSGILFVVAQRKIILCCYASSSFNHGGGEDEKINK
jgi:hypothetical protein